MLKTNFLHNSSDLFFFLHVDLHKLTPRKAESARYPPEAFELYKRFPKYPTSCLRDEQVAFIADMLDEEPPFPKEVYDLWIKFVREPVSTP